MIKHAAISAHAAAKPAATALLDLTTGRRLTWADYANLVAAAATGLSAALGDGPAPARAAFLAENRWEVPVVLGAAATLGLPMIGVDDSLPAEHVAACLLQVRPSVLVVSPARAGLARQALDLLDQLTTIPVVILLDPLGDNGDGDFPGARTWAEFTARTDSDTWRPLPFEGLGFTSGTTGAPKLVLRSRSFEARRHVDVTDFFAITADDVYLNTVPLYHASGPGWARLFATHGATVVIAADPSSAARALTTEGVTASLMVPPTLSAVLDHLDSRPPALRWVVTGGRHVSPDLVARTTAAMGEVLHVYYGTTETGLNTLTTAGELAAHPGTAGKPLPGNEILILDEDGTPVPAGVVGRVAIAGYMLADTYATAPAPLVHVDGKTAWLTADSGRLDLDGRVHLTARDIPAQARQVDAIGLEAHLKAALPATDVVVLVDTRAVIAYTTTTDLAPGDVLAAATAHTGALDTEAHLVPAIPYSPTGKVRVAALKALLPRTAATL
ncbi:class I adenylate-forming enzyme family protein [Actinokineospora sp. G85]|uniref:class I adenylate-forming enzyme family protein n=1 Tax=Actinokineospora sp. G85 TaxID=3406626 RepID=UPI003C757E63